MQVIERELSIPKISDLNKQEESQPSTYQPWQNTMQNTKMKLRKSLSKPSLHVNTYTCNSNVDINTSWNLWYIKWSWKSQANHVFTLAWQIHFPTYERRNNKTFCKLKIIETYISANKPEWHKQIYNISRTCHDISPFLCAPSRS